jgi:putative ABC transport system permease protein
MFARMRSVWRMVMRRARVERELDDEMRFHLEARADEMMRRGFSREEARRRARLEFGAVDKAKEETREARGVSFFDSLAQDLRFGGRMLRKSPGFTALAVVALALGIGANTAIFTVINAVLLRPLPYANPQELVTWDDNESQADIDDIRAQADFFAEGSGVNPEPVTYAGGAEPLTIRAGYADCDLFHVLGVQAALGRTFAQSECVSGGARTVVLSNSFWREYLGGDANAIGKSLTINDSSWTVIGVMPAGFSIPDYKMDLFVALRVADPDAAVQRDVHFLRSYWRLKPGVTLQQVASGMAAIDARLAAAYPDVEARRKTIPVSLQTEVTGEVRPALLVLTAAVGMVLLIACANFAGLLMARGVVRRREMTIRAALGGTRRRLMRQALTESMLLVLLGDLLGLPLAVFGVEAIVASKPAALEHITNVSVDSFVVLVGVAVSLSTAAIFGLVPAWQASRPDVAGEMNQDSRSATGGPAGQGYRRILVIAEMALALILLVGTGLLIRSFAQLRAVDPGFDPENVVSVYVQLPESRYEKIPSQIQFRMALLDRLHAIPGMETAMVAEIPFTGSSVAHSVAIEGRTYPIGAEPKPDTFGVMGDYFRVMRIPIRAGRSFTLMDRENQPLVVVINEAMARELFPGENPIGRRIHWARDEGAPRWMTIVGIAGDIKQYSLAEPAVPAVFLPFAQTDEKWRRWMYVVARTREPQRATIARIKSEIWSLDAHIPLNRVQSMEDVMGLSLAEQRFNMSLLGLFAALAVVLVAIGIYGVISYGVSQRTREIGIRIAIGADRHEVLGMFLAEGARLAAIGLIVGVVGGLALTRLMATLLFGVTPSDPMTFIAGALAMMAVAVVASWIPARRAMRVDPMEALRHE